MPNLLIWEFQDWTIEVTPNNFHQPPTKHKLVQVTEEEKMEILKEKPLKEVEAWAREQLNVII